MRQDMHFLFYGAGGHFLFQQVPDGAHRLVADHKFGATIVFQVLLHLIPEVMFCDELHERFQVRDRHFDQTFHVHRLGRLIPFLLHFNSSLRRNFRSARKSGESYTREEKVVQRNGGLDAGIAPMRVG
jgi:hypothetical protein